MKKNAPLFFCFIIHTNSETDNGNELLYQVALRHFQNTMSKVMHKGNKYERSTPLYQRNILFLVY